MTNAINYVNCMLIDFASENDLELYLKSREEIMTSELYYRFAKAHRASFRLHTEF